MDGVSLTADSEPHFIPKPTEPEGPDEDDDDEDKPEDPIEEICEKLDKGDVVTDVAKILKENAKGLKDAISSVVHDKAKKHKKPTCDDKPVKEDDKVHFITNDASAECVSVVKENDEVWGNLGVLEDDFEEDALVIAFY